MTHKNVFRRFVIALVALFLGIQVAPYGHDHQNPQVTSEPRWNSEETRDLAKRACFGCHSNETTWPWYSHIAPVSWLVQRDVQGGRRHLNFSEWDRVQSHAKDAAEQIKKGEMPPWFFLPLHAEARLNDAEKDRLIGGLTEMFGGGR
jgi:hypothetical protein